ncbi:uncharacterized protein [Rhodnius prolixus]|uniref:uncharacterized protein n=1 Tax=Rhodnius prolixus TaxID=13249 RepID=UPI003D18D5ED
MPQTEFVAQLKQTISQLRPVPAEWHATQRPFVHKALASCSHVFLRKEGHRRALTPPYEGPFRVIAKDHKTITLEKQGKQKTVPIDRVKPAFLTYITERSPQQATQQDQQRPAPQEAGNLQQSRSQTGYRSRAGRLILPPHRYGQPTTEGTGVAAAL